MSSPILDMENIHTRLDPSNMGRCGNGTGVHFGGGYYAPPYCVTPHYPPPPHSRGDQKWRGAGRGTHPQRTSRAVQLGKGGHPGIPPDPGSTSL